MFEIYPHWYRQSGRSTRMIHHALNQEDPVSILAHSMVHALTLVGQLDLEARRLEKPTAHISVSSYAVYNKYIDLAELKGQASLGHLPHFCSQPLLIDHCVFEAELNEVLRFLKSCPNSIQDMVRQANMLSALGKAVYLIVEGEQEVHYAKVNSAPGISIETEDSLFNYDWQHLKPTWNAHPNCVFIPDPVIVKRKWQKAIDEMNRWNLPYTGTGDVRTRV